MDTDFVDVELEKRMLGAYLRGELEPDFPSFFKPEDFTDPRHQVLMLAITALWLAGRQVDIHALTDDPEQHEYVESLLDEPPPESVEHFSDFVLRRRLDRYAHDLETALRRPDTRTLDLIVNFEIQLLEIASEFEGMKTTPIDLLVYLSLDHLHEQHQSRVVWPWGIGALDDAFGGLPTTGTTVLAGELHSDLLGLALQMATSYAQSRARVLFVAESLDKHALVSRMLYQLSGIPGRTLGKVEISVENAALLAKAAESLYAMPIDFNDRIVSASGFLRLCRDFRRRNEGPVVYVVEVTELERLETIRKLAAELSSPFVAVRFGKTEDVLRVVGPETLVFDLVQPEPNSATLALRTNGSLAAQSVRLSYEPKSGRFF